MFSRWQVLLLDRREERRFLIFCYARRTLDIVVSREVLTMRHFILELTTKETEILVGGISSDEGQKPNALGLENMLNCVDQE